MFKKVLFPTDFSEPAKSELDCITSIPGIREIILLHVIKQYAIPMGVETVESLEAEATEVYLREAKTYIAALNPAIRVTPDETTSADIAGAILDRAEKHQVDLIVIHANIKGIMAGMFLRSVHAKVLCRISKINVMIMPAKLVRSLTGTTYEKFCPMIFSRILCPTNFSEFSLKTTALAGTMKGVGEIVILHVVQPGEPGKDPDEAVRTAKVRIKELCDQLIGQGIKSRSIVVTGNPEDEIARIADVEDVSLIWMRSAGKGCLHDFFFGSMVHSVALHSTRPVIVIRSYES
jgi:nucleotide-binding universal stress UspA family protein